MARKRLQVEFEQAYQQTTLPDRPDFERVNAFLTRKETRPSERTAMIDYEKMMTHVKSLRFHSYSRPSVALTYTDSLRLTLTLICVVFIYCLSRR